MRRISVEIDFDLRAEARARWPRARCRRRAAGRSSGAAAQVGERLVVQVAGDAAPLGLGLVAPAAAASRRAGGSPRERGVGPRQRVLAIAPPTAPRARARAGPKARRWSAGRARARRRTRSASGSEAISSLVKARASTRYRPGAQVFHHELRVARERLPTTGVPPPSNREKEYWNCSGKVRLLVAAGRATRLFCGYSSSSPARTSSGWKTRWPITRRRLQRRPARAPARMRRAPVRADPEDLVSRRRAGQVPRRRCRDGRPCSVSSRAMIAPASSSTETFKSPSPGRRAPGHLRRAPAAEAARVVAPAITGRAACACERVKPARRWPARATPSPAPSIAQTALPRSASSAATGSACPPSKTKTPASAVPIQSALPVRAQAQHLALARRRPIRPARRACAACRPAARRPGRTARRKSPPGTADGADAVARRPSARPLLTRERSVGPALVERASPTKSPRRCRRAADRRSSSSIAWTVLPASSFDRLPAVAPARGRTARGSCRPTAARRAIDRARGRNCSPGLRRSRSARRRAGRSGTRPGRCRTRRRLRGRRTPHRRRSSAARPRVFSNVKRSTSPPSR